MGYFLSAKDAVRRIGKDVGPPIIVVFMDSPKLGPVKDSTSVTPVTLETEEL